MNSVCWLDVTCQCGTKMTLPVPLKHVAFVIEHMEGIQCPRCRPQDWLDGKYIYMPEDE